MLLLLLDVVKDNRKHRMDIYGGTQMMNSGKRFEDDFSKSVPQYCFLHRLKDTAQSYNSNKQTRFTWENPCDFFMLDSNAHLFYAIECKSTKFKSMSFQIDENDKSSKMIKYHQIKSLSDMSKYSGIVSGLLLNFRGENDDNQRTYFINIKDFNTMVNKINKSSFNEIDLIMYGNAVKISGLKKRTRYTWDIDSFLKNMNE